MTGSLNLHSARAEYRHSSWRGAIEQRRYGKHRESSCKRAFPFHDHLGKGYRTLKEMCRKYGISVRLYFKRCAMGYSLMRVLTTDVKKGLYSHLIAGRNAIEVCDHEGRKFKSKKEMCKYWGISPSTYDGRLKRGVSVEEALTTKVEKRSKKSKVLTKIIAESINPAYEAEAKKSNKAGYVAASTTLTGLSVAL